MIERSQKSEIRGKRLGAEGDGFILNQIENNINVQEHNPGNNYEKN